MRGRRDVKLGTFQCAPDPRTGKDGYLFHARDGIVGCVQVTTLYACSCSMHCTALCTLLYHTTLYTVVPHYFVLSTCALHSQYWAGGVASIAVTMVLALISVLGVVKQVREALYSATIKDAETTSAICSSSGSQKQSTAARRGSAYSTTSGVPSLHRLETRR